MTDLLGDRYQIGETLGFGGMSEVHRGRDLRLGRDVAIKVLRADLARDPSFQARFRREAQNAASLNHPAIVAVYDTGETRGETGPVPYIVMEYVDGQTLRDILRKEGPLPSTRAMEIMADVCAALDFSHRHGIVHRDVKPANIMLTKAGAVKVMDFGIARALNDGQATMTATAAVIGTAQYLSPEQARGEAVDARSDVYAAGCVLYELLTGVPPFVGDSPVAIAYQHVREDAKPPSEVNPRVPHELDSIVLKALNKNPLNRYQTAAEMRSDMVRALSGQAVHATPVMSDDERTELMRATPARTAGSASLLAPPSRVVPAEVPPDEDDGRRAKRVWGFVGVGALCLAVLAAAIWVTISLTTRPSAVKEVPVPDVTGMTQAEAVQSLRESGFEAETPVATVEVADDQVGRVQEQNPSGKTLRPTTDKVKITVGIKQALVQVPNLRGMSQADAQTSLTNAKLQAVFIQAPSSAPEKGQAIAQDKAAGTDVPPQTVVTVTISSGVKMIVVPDPATLVGQQFDAVKASLEALGFVVYQVPTDSSKPLNEVLTVTVKNGAPGSQVQVSTTVDVASSNNALFAIPPITQLSIDAANAALIAAGWNAGNAVQVDYVTTGQPAQYDKVMSSDPAQGTEYAKNGVIKVTVGVPAQVTTPDLKGRTVAEAQTLLANAGFTSSIVVTPQPSAPDQVGKILSQDPAANAVVKASTKVKVTVGATAPPATPPPGPTG